jgi:hypothetical protein
MILKQLGLLLTIYCKAKSHFSHNESQNFFKKIKQNYTYIHG